MPSYGPHDPSTAPVYPDVEWQQRSPKRGERPRRFRAPVDDTVYEQRKVINDLAYAASLAENESPESDVPVSLDGDP